MANKFILTTVGSGEEMAQTAAKRVAALCQEAIAERGHFTIALSGGSTPKRLYQILGESPYLEQLPWGKMTFLLGDERLVPITDKDSNYLMIKNSLLQNTPMEEKDLLRVYTDLSTPGASAGDYEKTIQTHLKLKDGQLPEIDLILLGMGPDGHTASLFPGTEALKDRDHLVRANFVAKFNSWRITLTAPVLQNARNVLFMVGGKDKAPALKEVLEGQPQESLYPSQLLREAKGKVEWLLDKEITTDLHQSLSNSSAGVK